MFNDLQMFDVFYIAVMLFPFAIPAVHAIVDRASSAVIRMAAAARWLAVASRRRGAQREGPLPRPAPTDCLTGLVGLLVGSAVVPVHDDRGSAADPAPVRREAKCTRSALGPRNKQGCRQLDSGATCCLAAARFFAKLDGATPMLRFRDLGPNTNSASETLHSKPSVLPRDRAVMASQTPRAGDAPRLTPKEKSL